MVVAAAKSESHEAVTTALHKFFLSLLSEIHDDVKAGSYNCTFTRLIILLQLQKDGSLKDPKLISHSIAGLQWCVRAVMSVEINKRAEATVPKDVVNACDEVMRMCVYDLRVSPYSQIQKWLRITYAISQNGLGDGKLYWGRSDHVMIYLGLRVSIFDWGGLAFRPDFESGEAVEGKASFRARRKYEDS